MKSESSTVVAFRALVMLACLLSIPAAALWGGSLPELVKQLLQQHLGLSLASASSTLSEAPPFVPGSSGTILADPIAGAPATLPPLSPPVVQLGPQAVPPQVALAPQLGPSATPLQAPPTTADYTQMPANGTPGVVPAGYQLPAEPMPADAMPREFSPPVRQPGPSVYQRNKPGLVPVCFDEACPPPNAAPEKSPTDNQFQQIQERLRRLGATYYLLESWGAQGDLYRFYCKMAVGGNPNYTRYFEAVDSDPVRVMGKVLQDVEVWRAGPM